MQIHLIQFLWGLDISRTLLFLVWLLNGIERVLQFVFLVCMTNFVKLLLSFSRTAERKILGSNDSVGIRSLTRLD